MAHPTKAEWDEAVRQFWAEVRGRLTAKYRHAPEAADDGITTYRRLLRKRGAEGVTYNAGEDAAAAVIDATLREGSATPTPVASARRTS